MAYKLQPGETAADAAQKMLGDARLVNELSVIPQQDGEYAFLHDEGPGPPARWASDPKFLWPGESENGRTR